MWTHHECSYNGWCLHWDCDHHAGSHLHFKHLRWGALMPFDVSMNLANNRPRLWHCVQSHQTVLLWQMKISMSCLKLPRACMLLQSHLQILSNCHFYYGCSNRTTVYFLISTRTSPENCRVDWTKFLWDIRGTQWVSSCLGFFKFQNIFSQMTCSLLPESVNLVVDSWKSGKQP